jgi:hypothetical protein
VVTGTPGFDPDWKLTSPSKYGWKEFTEVVAAIRLKTAAGCDVGGWKHPRLGRHSLPS